MTLTIDASAADHDIVDDRKAAFACHVIAVTAPDIGIRKHRSLVELHATLVLLSGHGDVVRVEPLPDRPVEDLIRRVAEYVHNGIGRVENASLIGEVYRR